MSDLKEGMQECPAHDDGKASLSIKKVDEKWLIHCFAGCDTQSVINALGIEWKDLFTTNGDPVVDVYVYEDEDRQPILRVLRTFPKGFWQQRYESGTWTWGLTSDTRRVLYRLPQLLNSDPRVPVYIVEGEKDVETLRARGYTATCSLGGAGKWREDYTDSLRGRTARIVADTDDAGTAHVARIAESFDRAGVKYSVLRPAEGKDVTEHVEAGLDVSALVPFSLVSEEVLEPFDPSAYEAEPTEWILEPWIPRNSRVLAFGSAGSLKSLWAMWLAGKMSLHGQRVAYFSLEMSKTQLVNRCKNLNWSPDNLKFFTRFSFTNKNQLYTATKLFEGYDMIVVDSWSAAHQNQNDNDAIARLDNEVFQPILDTGATLLILDNTGHDQKGFDGTVKSDHARGGSAKGDKMDITLWFDRPDEENNYRTRLTVKKMRLDHPIPGSVIVETDRDYIDFFHVVGGMRYGNMWGGRVVDDPGNGQSAGGQERSQPAAPSTTLKERLAHAKLRHQQDVEDQAIARIQSELGAEVIV